ncbi:MAG: hypothetical protein E7302_07955 [Butyrivibrio sp.]|nr:hypothetical protein [Butyrivibrio sp.]
MFLGTNRYGLLDEITEILFCCGGGYSLTILGFFYSADIMKIYGSDVDENMLEHAKKNLALLQDEGLMKREQELSELYETYHKESHKDALSSIDVLRKQLVKPVSYEVFQADCTKPLPRVNADIIITDIPYGNLVDWNDGESDSLELMLAQLAKTSDKEMVLALSMDKKQKVNSKTWDVLEKHNIGKRKFMIMKNK